MSKPRLAAVCLCAVMLLASLVSPAFGGPSLGSVARTAKKALKTATRADRKATYLATHYQPVDSVTEQQEVSAAPGSFADFEVHCPRDYVSSGHGAGYGALIPVAAIPLHDGYLASMYNDSTQTFSGKLYVHCIYGDHTENARASVLSAREELRQTKRTFLSANAR